MTRDRHPRTTAALKEVTFNLPERLDALNADGVYMEVHRTLKQGIGRLTLDAGTMAYISSKGIRALLRLREELHRNGGVIILENLQSFATAVLKASGLGDDLTGLHREAAGVCR